MGQYLLIVGSLLFGMYVSLFLHIVIHEAGHLICGYISGYQFYSFRIGSIMWVKDVDTGKILRKKLKVAGTGGQCLMSPPDLVDGQFPVMLYNLGGVIANVAVSALFLGLYFITKDIRIVPMLCMLMVIMGMGTAITNGVPMRLQGIDNDGRNALSMKQDPSAVRSFWIQLKISEQVARGVRLRDMPEEWFVVPDDAAMKHCIHAAVGVFACNRLMDHQWFYEAETLMERLLSMKTGIAGIHRGVMICDLVYCKLLRKESAEKVDALMTPEQKQFLKAMKTFPFAVRTEYVYALLREKDEEKAAKLLETFDEVAKSYPYPSDVESERELMVLAAESNSSYGYCIE